MQQTPSFPPENAHQWLLSAYIAETPADGFACTPTWALPGRQWPYRADTSRFGGCPLHLASIEQVMNHTHPI